MAELLLLTANGDDSHAVLPALELLPHRIIAAPLRPTVLVDLPRYDLIAIDARIDLVSARALCKTAASIASEIPILLIVNAGALSVFSQDWGMNDFVLDSVTPGELDARIRLLMDAASLGPKGTEEMRFGELIIDSKAYTAKIGSTLLDLTYKEFELLKYLSLNPGHVLTRARLLQEVWGYDYYGGTRTVDVHVRRLRAKLGPEYDQLIGTVRNVGYRFDPETERPSAGQEQE